MPTKIEKDSVTGRETTGHEWDGLKELNTPLPKWWLYVFYLTIATSVLQFVLYPSFSYGPGYLHGVLGYTTRQEVDQDVAKIVAKRKADMDKIGTLSFAQIKADPKLLEVALVDGKQVFASNCQPCHGAGGGGNPGYPALAAGAWIWGGTLDAIQKTVTYGVRSDDPNARTSAMPAFGAGLLTQPQIQAVADYVWVTFYGNKADGRDVSEGAKVFNANCAVCHGVKGEGNKLMGAPRLASQVHLYGNTREAIMAQVMGPKMGVMPAWNTRLDPATIKAVTLYVHSLGGGE
ncbi:MAG: cytochrome-c oxidase, cbb3-type subunit III [Acetobacteraceae bacterium]|nr:cytochrome-c oxidase, cbb3-type subunit III [Pseudomonadota bacterium]